VAGTSALGGREVVAVHTVSIPLRRGYSKAAEFQFREREADGGAVGLFIARREWLGPQVAEYRIVIPKAAAGCSKRP
jgi:hypothetical protein